VYCLDNEWNLETTVSVFFEIMSETWKPLPVYFWDDEWNLQTNEWNLATIPIVFLDNESILETTTSIFFR
jgi:hypothetical protein